MTETELIGRAREGDPQAFRRLYDDHVERVFRLAYRLSGEDDLARECTQDAFVRAFERLDQFRGDAAFGTWLHTIATSVTLNRIRKLRRHRSRERPLEDHRDLGSLPRTPEPRLRERLHAAIDALPEIYRTVFLLHDLEGYKHQEIAGMLNVAVGTSKARLSRARGQLRAALGDIAEEYVG